MTPARSQAAVAVLLLLAAGCQRPAPPPESAVATLPALEAPAELALGRAIAGTRVTGELVVRATRPVRLLSVESSCECTTATAAGLPRELRAGETVAVAVEMDLSKVGRGGLPKEGEAGPGRVRREVIVKSAEGEIRSGVTVEVSDAVLIDPPLLSFATIALGTTARGSIRVLPAGSTPNVAILSARTTEPGLIVKIAPEGRGGRLDFEWTPPEAGRRMAEVALTLDHPGDENAIVRVAAAVVAPVTVYPTGIENLAASITQPVVTMLTVRRLDEEPLNLRSVSTDNHRVQVKVQPGQGAVRMVQVVIPVLAPPTEMAGTIVILTDVPGGERLTVPFRVSAAPPG